MTSTLQVQTLQGPTSGADSNTVRVADGHNLHAKGHVVQTVYYEWNTEFQTSSNSYVSVTGSSVSITPKFSNSKIIVDAGVSLTSFRNSTNSGGSIRIVENGVSLQDTADAQPYIKAGGSSEVVFNILTFKRNECQTTVTAGVQKTFSLELISHATAEETINAGGNYGSTMTVWEIAQ